MEPQSTVQSKGQGDFQSIIDTAVRGLLLIAAMVVAILAIRAAFRRRRRSSKMAGVPTAPTAERIEWEARVNQPVDSPRKRAEMLLDQVDVSMRLSAPMSWSRELLKAMEWKRFEELCCEFWLLKGYPAKLTGPGADGGVDVVIADRKDPSKCFAIVQCKSHTQWIGVGPVRELWGSKDHFNATLAIFYSVSGFSPDAKAFAEGKHLKLVDSDALLEQISSLPAPDQIALLAKVTRGDYQTPSCPQCEVKLVQRKGGAGRPDFWGCKNFRTCRFHGFPSRPAGF